MGPDGDVLQLLLRRFLAGRLDLDFEIFDLSMESDSPPVALADAADADGCSVLSLKKSDVVAVNDPLTFLEETDYLSFDLIFGLTHTYGRRDR